MKFTPLPILILIFSWSCCTKKICNCPEVKIEIYSKSMAWTARADENFVVIDTLSLHYQKETETGHFHTNLKEGAFPIIAGKTLKDFNYIIINISTHHKDTIKNISYDTRPYSFECNECFPGNDIQHCDDIINKKLKVNEISQEGFEIYL